MMKEMGCGFRNRDHSKTAIYFHCGGSISTPELKGYPYDQNPDLNVLGLLTQKPDAPLFFDNPMPHGVGLFQIREVRMRAVVMSLVVLALAGSTACNRGVHSKAAVQEAIEQHLKQQPNVVFQNMTLEVDDVSFHGDTAEAQVKFRSKQAPSLAVGVHYKLRRADGGWQVESASSASMPGATPHGNTARPMPPASENPADISPQPSH